MFSLRGLDTPGELSVRYYKGHNFCHTVCLPEYRFPSEKGSTLKGKNLLLLGVILYF